MSQRDILFIGLPPRVIALDAATGEIVWATELPSSGHVVTLRVHDGRIFAGSAGEVSCLDAANGQVIWHNPLKGMGIHPVLFAAEGGAVAVQAMEASGAAGAAVVGASGA